MEPEGLSNYLQDPATCPCPEPDHPIQVPYSIPWISSLILSLEGFHICLFRPLHFYLSKPRIHLSSSPFMPHA